MGDEKRDPVFCMLRDMADNPTLFAGVGVLLGTNLSQLHGWLIGRWGLMIEAERTVYLAKWGLKKPPCWLVPPYECPAREGEDG